MASILRKTVRHNFAVSRVGIAGSLTRKCIARYNNLDTPMEVCRCTWAESYKGEIREMYLQYHDDEWGVPVRGDDRQLFELLCLEGAQAGLSWSTILKKREGYRRSFYNFDIKKVAIMTEQEIESLLKTEESVVVRHRLKLMGTVKNAKAVIELSAEEKFKSSKSPFSDYLWSFLPNGLPIQNEFVNMEDVPTSTSLSVEISKDLKRRGFTFVGPTIIYAFMQATGMVNDHLVGCFRYKIVQEMDHGISSQSLKARRDGKTSQDNIPRKLARKKRAN